MRTDILIVDDNPNNLFVLESLLAAPGINIVRANSGNEALAMTLTHEFAITLLDVEMPDMDGFETAELMRSNSRTRHIPIIFVTANRTEEECIFRGYGTGAVDYLPKPLNVDVLKTKVNVFLELHRQRQALEAKTRELDAKIEEMESLQALLEQRNEQLNVLSRTDRLTNIPNRRSFDERLSQEWNHCIRNSVPLTIVFADIDHFKPYNDTLGHVAGDQCLKQIAMALSASLMRKVDTIARFGGEEFAIILPDTDENGAMEVVNRMYAAIKTLNIIHPASDTSTCVTISVGVASTSYAPEATQTELIDMADTAMYHAKTTGRNRFALFNEIRKTA